MSPLRLPCSRLNSPDRRMKAGMGCQGNGVRGGNHKGISPASCPYRNWCFLLNDGGVEGETWLSVLVTTDLGQTDGMLPHSLGKRGLCWSLPSCNAPIQPVCLGNKFKFCIVMRNKPNSRVGPTTTYLVVHLCITKAVFSCCVAQTDKMTR